MVTLSTVHGKPSPIPAPAKHRTMCPSCGVFSPYGALCGMCMETVVASEKNVKHVCPSCHAYSPCSVVCDACILGLLDLPAAPAQTVLSGAMWIGDVQLFVAAAVDADAGHCDVQMLVGPDAVDSCEVLTPAEHVAMIRRMCEHLRAYADDFETAFSADTAEVA